MAGVRVGTQSPTEYMNDHLGEQSPGGYANHEQSAFNAETRNEQNQAGVGNVPADTQPASGDAAAKVGPGKGSDTPLTGGKPEEHTYVDYNGKTQPKGPDNWTLPVSGAERAASDAEFARGSGSMLGGEFRSGKPNPPAVDNPTPITKGPPSDLDSTFAPNPGLTSFSSPAQRLGEDGSVLGTAKNETSESKPFRAKPGVDKFGRKVATPVNQGGSDILAKTATLSAAEKMNAPVLSGEDQADYDQRMKDAVARKETVAAPAKKQYGIK